MKVFYVYKITNLKNGKLYFGKTGCGSKRWTAHRNNAESGNDDCPKLYRSMRKHGVDSFSFQLLAGFKSEQDSFEFETFCILQSKSNEIGYNLTIGGDGASGYTHTDENLQYMSEIKKVSYLGAGNPFYGRTHTDESKVKIGLPKVGLAYSDEEKMERGGENYVGAKLTAQDVVNIRELFATKLYSKTALGKQFNCNAATIFNIVNRYTWKYLGDDGTYSKDNCPVDLKKTYAPLRKKQKITEADVIAIRAEYAAGGITHLELAERYQLTRRYVGEIISRRTWKNI